MLFCLRSPTTQAGSLLPSLRWVILTEMANSPCSGKRVHHSGCASSGAGVGVLLGNGDGTFQAAVTYGSGGSSGPFRPVSIIIADVNGDREPDLVAAMVAPVPVGVLLGDGDGTFQAAVGYGSGGPSPMSVAVADVNGDGKSDLFVANKCADSNCDGSVGVLLGNGDGTFRAAVAYSSGGVYGLAVAVAEVNSDGASETAGGERMRQHHLCRTQGSGGPSRR